MKEHSTRNDGDGALPGAGGMADSPAFIGRVLGLTPNRIFVKNREGEYLYVNKAAAKLFGGTAEKLLGKSDQEFALRLGLDEKALERYRREDLYVIDHGRSLFIPENRFELPDGEVKWYQTKKVPIELSPGGRCVLGVAVDITEHKLAETELALSEERYRSVVESQSELICRFTPDTLFTFVNDAYSRYFDTAPEKLIGTSFRTLIPEEDWPRVESHTRSLTKENPEGTIEHRVVLPDGSFRWQGWTDRAFFDAQGRVIQYQSVGRDITDRKRMEDELKSRETELEHQSRNLQEMNAALKVLLRRRDQDRKEQEENILTNVRQLVLPFLERLGESGLDERQRGFLQAALTNLDEITSPFAREMGTAFFKLSPSELKVANLVKQGKSAKEIAEILSLSKGTVDFYRNRIREKLGLKNKKINLRTKLLSLDSQT